MNPRECPHTIALSFQPMPTSAATASGGNHHAPQGSSSARTSAAGTVSAAAVNACAAAAPTAAVVSLGRGAADVATAAAVEFLNTHTPSEVVAVLSQMPVVALPSASSSGDAGVVVVVDAADATRQRLETADHALLAESPLEGTGTHAAAAAAPARARPREGHVRQGDAAGWNRSNNIHFLLQGWTNSATDETVAAVGATAGANAPATTAAEPPQRSNAVLPLAAPKPLAAAADGLELRTNTPATGDLAHLGVTEGAVAVVVKAPVLAALVRDAAERRGTVVDGGAEVAVAAAAVAAAASTRLRAASCPDPTATAAAVATARPLPSPSPPLLPTSGVAWLLPTPSQAQREEMQRDAAQLPPPAAVDAPPCDTPSTAAAAVAATGDVAGDHSGRRRHVRGRGVATKARPHRHCCPPLSRSFRSAHGPAVVAPLTASLLAAIAKQTVSSPIYAGPSAARLGRMSRVGGGVGGAYSTPLGPHEASPSAFPMAGTHRAAAVGSMAATATSGSLVSPSSMADAVATFARRHCGDDGGGGQSETSASHTTMELPPHFAADAPPESPTAVGSEQQVLGRRASSTASAPTDDPHFIPGMPFFHSGSAASLLAKGKPGTTPSEQPLLLVPPRTAPLLALADSAGGKERQEPAHGSTNTTSASATAPAQTASFLVPSFDEGVVRHSSLTSPLADGTSSTAFPDTASSPHATFHEPRQSRPGRAGRPLQMPSFGRAFPADGSCSTTNTGVAALSTEESGLSFGTREKYNRQRPLCHHQGQRDISENDWGEESGASAIVRSYHRAFSSVASEDVVRTLARGMVIGGGSSFAAFPVNHSSSIRATAETGSSATPVHLKTPPLAPHRARKHHTIGPSNNRNSDSNSATAEGEEDEGASEGSESVGGVGGGVALPHSLNVSPDPAYTPGMLWNSPSRNPDPGSASFLSRHIHLPHPQRPHRHRRQSQQLQEQPQPPPTCSLPLSLRQRREEDEATAGQSDSLALWSAGGRPVSDRSPMRTQSSVTPMRSGLVEGTMSGSPSFFAAAEKGLSEEECDALLKNESLSQHPLRRRRAHLHHGQRLSVTPIAPESRKVDSGASGGGFTPVLGDRTRANTAAAAVTEELPHGEGRADSSMASLSHASTGDGSLRQDADTAAGVDGLPQPEGSNTRYPWASVDNLGAGAIPRVMLCGGSCEGTAEAAAADETACHTRSSPAVDVLRAPSQASSSPREPMSPAEPCEEGDGRGVGRRSSSPSCERSLAGTQVQSVPTTTPSSPLHSVAMVVVPRNDAADSSAVSDAAQDGLCVSLSNELHAWPRRAFNAPPQDHATSSSFAGSRSTGWNTTGAGAGVFSASMAAASDTAHPQSFLFSTHLPSSTTAVATTSSETQHDERPNSPLSPTPAPARSPSPHPTRATAFLVPDPFLSNFTRLSSRDADTPNGHTKGSSSAVPSSFKASGSLSNTETGHQPEEDSEAAARDSHSHSHSHSHRRSHRLSVTANGENPCKSLPLPQPTNSSSNDSSSGTTATSTTTASSAYDCWRQWELLLSSNAARSWRSVPHPGTSSSRGSVAHSRSSSRSSSSSRATAALTQALVQQYGERSLSMDGPSTGAFHHGRGGGWPVGGSALHSHRLPAFRVPVDVEALLDAAEERLRRSAVPVVEVLGSSRGRDGRGGTGDGTDGRGGSSHRRRHRRPIAAQRQLCAPASTDDAPPPSSSLSVPSADLSTSHAEGAVVARAAAEANAASGSGVDSQGHDNTSPSIDEKSITSFGRP